MKKNILFQTPSNFLTVKKATNCSFFYTERKGIDSVSIVLIDRKRKAIGLVREAKPPFNERENSKEMSFKITALGGSLFDMVDTKKYMKMSFKKKLKIAKETAINEAREESGYTVPDKNVKFIKRVVFDSMSNEYVWLFVIEVDKYKNLGEKEPQNRVEAMITNQWFKYEDFFDKVEDGKARATLIDYFYKEKIIKFV